jgi:hypothetical protein
VPHKASSGFLSSSGSCLRLVGLLLAELEKRGADRGLFNLLEGFLATARGSCQINLAFFSDPGLISPMIDLADQRFLDGRSRVLPAPFGK